jgi:hypothetical protein
VRLKSNLLGLADLTGILNWPMGEEWMFAQERYENHFGIAGYEYDNNLQNYMIGSSASDYEMIYTSIVVDMIDNENQRVVRHSGSIDFPNDNVEYYTISEIEDGLRGARSWNQWRDNMSGISNPTSTNLDELFANWY